MSRNLIKLRLKMISRLDGYPFYGKFSLFDVLAMSAGYLSLIAAGVGTRRGLGLLDT